LRGVPLETGFGVGAFGAAGRVVRLRFGRVRIGHARLPDLRHLLLNLGAELFGQVV
jgi:hypothetical protein